MGPPSASLSATNALNASMCGGQSAISVHGIRGLAEVRGVPIVVGMPLRGGGVGCLRLNTYKQNWVLRKWHGSSNVRDMDIGTTGEGEVGGHRRHCTLCALK